MTKLEQKKLCAEAKEKFGKYFWCKPGSEFDSSGAVLWTGDGAILEDGLVACNSYSQDYDTYPTGVHKDLEAWAKEKGIFFEFYDAGTLLAYKD
jgi:hypothetical protein